MDMSGYLLDLYQLAFNQWPFCAGVWQSRAFKINIHLRVFVCRLRGFKVK